jgi:hypothetical protein
MYWIEPWFRKKVTGVAEKGHGLVNPEITVIYMARIGWVMRPRERQTPDWRIMGW